MRRWTAGVLIVIAGATAATTPAQAPDRTVMKGHMLPALSKAKKLPPQPVAAKEPISITVVLGYTDPRAFDAFAKEQERARAAGTFKPLSPVQIAARFGPSQAVYDATIAYFKAEGFTLVGGSANRRTLTFSGTRAMAEHAFAVKIADFQLGDRKFFANTGEPSLPSRLAKDVVSIWGLSSYGHLRRLIAPAPTPAAIARAYGLGAVVPDLNLGRGGLDGSGQIIGLPQLFTFDRNDIELFLSSVGLDPALARQVQVVPLAGGTTVGDPEVTLDIETALGIAPHLSQVQVFVAPRTLDLAALLNMSITALPTSTTAARVISLSYGECESDFTSTQLDTVDATIVAGNLMGVSVFVASGDFGGTCPTCDSSGLCFSGTGASFPASAPHAIAVGGTNLQVTGAGAYSSESYWNDPSLGVSGGFGTSAHFARPSWQAGFTSSAKRSVPDVSADADGRTGFTLCFAGTCSLPGNGTSMATPIWAASWALIVQASGGALQVATPALLYSMAGSSVFHSPGSMSPPSDFAHVGLGSPNIAAFVPECGNRKDEPCCNGSTCVAAFACAQGRCECGAVGQPCCGAGVGAGPCGPSLVCAAGRCSCGGGGQPCCAPDQTCHGNFTCVAGDVCHCGGLEEACCSGTTCNDARLTCSTARQECISACGHRGQPCCNTASTAGAIPSATGPGPAWCYGGEGVSCANGSCSCGGLNQACCRTGSACAAGLTCANLVCLRPNSTGTTCATCNTNLARCLQGCATDPNHQALCNCLCQTTACDCRTQNRCGIFCNAPVCNRP